jgi:transposase
MLSAIAGITFWNFYFRLYPGAIRSEQAIDFVGRLLQHIPGKLLIIWDGLAVHRSRKVRAFVEGTGGRVMLEQLPAYAPELNPTEFIWAYWKKHELPNLCPQDYWDLTWHAREALRRMRRRPRLIRSFWKQADLFA